MTKAKRPHELRATTDLALRRETRPDSDVFAMLQPMLSAIKGGENAPDVRNAHRLVTGEA
jgi:hypothetical protein